MDWTLEEYTKVIGILRSKIRGTRKNRDLYLEIAQEAFGVDRYYLTTNRS